MMFLKLLGFMKLVPLLFTKASFIKTIYNDNNDKKKKKKKKKTSKYLSLFFFLKEK